jgi:uncharacterized membrane protein YfbV (UPF0208 family)
MSRKDVASQRIDVFIRLVGLILVALGLVVFVATATTPLNPALAALYYLVSIVFLGSGLLALIARFA